MYINNIIRPVSRNTKLKVTKYLVIFQVSKKQDKLIITYLIEQTNIEHCFRSF